jgi:HSP20 family protein
MAKKESIQNTEALERRGEGDLERVQQGKAMPPRVDVYENDSELLLIADLPGVDEKHLNIHLENEQLIIEGQREESLLGKPLIGEYQPVDYFRAFSMHQGIDANRITAELKQGVLRLHLPKSESIRPRQIRVKAG